MTSKPYTISLLELVPPTRKSWLTKALVAMADSLLGISKMNSIYQAHKMQGLDKDTFVEHFIRAFDLAIEGQHTLVERIPKQGPLVIAANHPFGGIEGVVLSWLISRQRPDLKVLANQGLAVFPELQDYFIFTNPLSEKNPRNGPSLKASLQHVKQDGALLIFPAGRVSYYRKDLKRISEHQWNRIVAKLIRSVNANYLPLFIPGQNSPWFYRLGRVHETLRMLRLGHELLNKVGSTLTIQTGHCVPANAFAKGIDLTEQAAVCRAMSYAQDASWKLPWHAESATTLSPIAAPTDKALLAQEISQLPSQQHLYQHKHYQLYYGFQAQMPHVVNEIARLREQVFREHQEGSGQPIDTDNFDGSYTHIFLYDSAQQAIIGAYRLGQTDKLLAQQGIDGLYLSRVFDFGQHFINQQQPCLELGRSFVIPEYQRSYLGLHLLWKGIAAFLQRHPQYQHLYGTVSISKLYNRKSVALLNQALVKPSAEVNAKQPFEHKISPELLDFANQYSLPTHLNSLIRSIETDGKGTPVLIKHYQKLGAQFYALGLDKHFNHTPGLLLHVDLKQLPQAQRRRYFE